MFWWLHRTLRVVVRPLPSANSLHCAAIHAPAFAHPWSGAEFERLLSADNIVAEGAFEINGERLMGMVLSRRAAEEAEILTIAVAIERRRQGIAKVLLAAHLGRLSSLGIKTLFLEVGTNNKAAVALYEGFGFRQVGRRPGYYKDTDGRYVAALILRRDLA